MHLADIGHLKSEEVQLLADSRQPVFSPQLTPAAETLIQGELLNALRAICQNSKRACFVLTTTDKGTAYVAGWAGFLTLAFALLVFNGCGYYSAPKVIEADGASYVACSGIVHVSSDGGLFGSETTYSISFTNDDNTDTVVRGVRSVTITSIPTLVKSSLQTNLPDPKTDTDKNRTPFVEGSTYLSGGPGDKMMTFRNGVWVPEINTACYGTK